MSETFIASIDDEFLFVLAVVAMGCITAIVMSLIAVFRSVAVARAREQTKREIAAYVAEGTIDPKHAIAMIEAGAEIEEIDDDQRRARALRQNRPAVGQGECAV